LKLITDINPFILAGAIWLGLLPAQSALAQTDGRAQFHRVAISEPSELNGVVLQYAESGPADEGIPPAVVLLGGSNGGIWFGHIGMDFISRGVSTVSLSYFGHDGQPDHLIERPLEPIADALEMVRGSRGATRRCLAIVGVSKGGELALLLAAYQSELATTGASLADAYVAAVPSHVVWQAPHATLRVRSSWALDDEPMPFVPYRWASSHLPDVFFNRLEVGAFIADSLNNPAAVEAAAIPTERIVQPTLLIAGTNDLMWPSAEMSQAAMNRAEHLNPDTPVRLELRDLDHFVLSDPEARRTAVEFVVDHLRQAAASGHCDADFD